MSLQYDSLHDGIVAAIDSQERLSQSIDLFASSVERRFQTEGELIAEIRDELHEAIMVLSNRIEAMKRV